MYNAKDENIYKNSFNYIIYTGMDSPTKSKFNSISGYEIYFATVT